MARKARHALISLILCGLGTFSGASHAGATATGFLDKVHTGRRGLEVKYVVFIPHEYDGTRAFPVILYLHGTGLTGTDGREHIKGSLADVVRRQEKTFPFIVVFPQSHAGSWRADSPDGKLAIAILDDVQRSYRVDPERVYLTGASMGGDGTWSLAAAYPERWAAIVPVCGKGDPRTAAKIRGIPCWCFQGDADFPERAREMIRALSRAGGRPLYHEFPGVGHNCWGLTYAMPDLYEWLLQQKRN
jgi:predicted peptidase